jgi:hypothetical protein
LKRGDAVFNFPLLSVYWRRFGGGIHAGEIISDGIEGTLDMADGEGERLHVDAPADDFGDLTGVNPNKVIMIGLENESFAAEEVVVRVDSEVASKRFFLDYRPAEGVGGEFFGGKVDGK